MDYEVRIGRYFAVTSERILKIMRSLFFDFAHDPEIADIKDTYMFGREFLVSPVTMPMYYGIDNQIISNEPKVKEVYLPKGADWYDFWEDEYLEGGQWISCPAPIERMPLFVKAGSIIPVSEDQYYADEKQGYAKEILIYSGADEDFTIYNDDGNDYSFEDGNFYMIKINYDDEKKEISFDSVKGDMKFQREFHIRYIEPEKMSQNYDFVYNGLSSSLKL